jgi:PAS domain S-box-containing protein
MGSAEVDLRRWWLVVVAAVSLVLVAAGGITYKLVGELRSDEDHVVYERAEDMRNADALGIAVFRRTANARGYLLSGDPSFLTARSAARGQIAPLLGRLLANADGNLLQHALATQVLFARLDAASDHAIAVYAASPDRARTLWEETARPIQAEIEQRVASLLAIQRTAFEAARDDAAAAAASSVRLLVILLATITVVIATLIYVYARAARTLVAKHKEEQQQTTFRLIEQVPVGIFVTTPDGQPYYANRHAKKLLGRGVERAPDGLAPAYQAYEAGTDRLYPEARLPIARALAGQVAEVTDMEIRRDGDVIPLHVVGAPVFDSRGQLIYAVAGFQDVRELQRVAMRDALTGLANRRVPAAVRARTRLRAAHQAPPRDRPHRSRSLQVDQRHAWPCGRRHRARAHGCHSRRDVAPHRRRRPLGRRGARRAHARQRSRRRRARPPAQPRGNPCARVPGQGRRAVLGHVLRGRRRRQFRREARGRHRPCRRAPLRREDSRPQSRADARARVGGKLGRLRVPDRLGLAVLECAPAPPHEQRIR